MAYMILHSNDGKLAVQVDTLADLYQIPSCAAGSYAYQSGCERFWEMSEDGVWIPGGAASSGGGGGEGGGLFVVTVTEDGEGGYTADKTFEEIEAAYEAGTVCQARMERPKSVGGGYQYYALGRANDGDFGFGPQFTEVGADQSGIYVRVRLIEFTNTPEIMVTEALVRGELPT